MTEGPGGMLLPVATKRYWLQNVPAMMDVRIARRRQSPGSGWMLQGKTWTGREVWVRPAGPQGASGP